MDRKLLIVWLAVGLFPVGVSAAEEAPAPWATKPSVTGDAAIADWASQLAPAKREPALLPSAANPARAASAPAELATGNPLRKGAATPAPVVRAQATSDFAAPPLGPAADAPAPASNPFATSPFAPSPSAASPSAAAPPTAGPAATPPGSKTPPTRIAVGAAPATPNPFAAAEATALSRPQATPTPTAPAAPSVVATPAASPAAPPSRAASPAGEPIRIASATPLPSRVEPAPLAAAPAEGNGHPGPPRLEGPQEASLAVEKRAPREAQLGKPCRFVVKVRNTGTGPAENVVLTDQTPAGARLLKTQPVADLQGSRIVWRLGTIPAGDERTVEVELEPLREGPLGSVATVTMDASASAATNCTRPLLALRVASIGKLRLGDEQPITIEVHNPGTGTAAGVMLVADVPRQLRHEAGTALEYEVGSLAPGESRRVDLAMTAAEAGRVALKVAAVADGGLRAEGSTDLEVVAPSLAVTIDGPAKRYLERPASYTIGVDNPGTAPATDVRLVTRLPRGMEFVSANNLGEYDATTHSVYWSLAELPEGERGEVEVVAMPVAPGEHTLTAQSEAGDGLEATHTHTVRVEGVASLAFEVRDLADPVEVGDETIYEVRVLNEGTQAATGVRVRVEAPSGLRIAGADGDTAPELAASRVVFAAIPRLEPGQKAAFRVRAVAAEAGDQRVAVLVESDDLSRPIRREESTRVFGDE